VNDSPVRTESRIRVRYAETDQMGVAYHANYLVWCEVGRTDLLRSLGATYAQLEEGGLRLAVAEAGVRYLAGARYDDLVRIETTVRRVQSRGVTFDYELWREAEGEGEGAGAEVRLATATTTLVALGADNRPRRMDTDLRALLQGGGRRREPGGR